MLPTGCWSEVTKDSGGLGGVESMVHGKWDQEMWIRSPGGTHGQEREKDVFDSGESPLVPRVAVNLIRTSRKRI